MPYKNRRSSYSTFILIFVALKIVLNLFAISNFGFHRDELLHLVLGDHLDWGYKEVPPFIALLAKITLNVFGDSVFAARIFSTIASGFIIWLTGQITVELGGRRFAITLAFLALIFSPAFAARPFWTSVWYFSCSCSPWPHATESPSTTMRKVSTTMATALDARPSASSTRMVAASPLGEG